MALHLDAPTTERHQPWQRTYADVEAAYAASFTAADDGLSVLITGEALGPLHFVVRDVGGGTYKPTPIVGIAATYEAAFANPAGVEIDIPAAGEVVVNTTSLPGLTELLRVPREDVIWDVDLATGVFTLRRAGRIRLAFSLRHAVDANEEFYVSVQRWNGATWDDVDEILSEDYRLTSGTLTRSDLLAVDVLADDQFRFAVRHRGGVQRTWTFYRMISAANYVRLG